MPATTVWLRIKLTTVWEYIALLEVQQRQQHADGIRFLVRWSGYRVDETAIKAHRAALTQHSRDE